MKHVSVEMVSGKQYSLQMTEEELETLLVSFGADNPELPLRDSLQVMTFNRNGEAVSIKVAHIAAIESRVPVLRRLTPILQPEPGQEVIDCRTGALLECEER